MNLSIIHLFQTLKRLPEQLHHPVTRERIPHEHRVPLLIQKETVEAVIFWYAHVSLCKAAAVVYIDKIREIQDIRGKKHLIS